jgi:transglutaminase-like putative cysteine protease
MPFSAYFRFSSYAMIACGALALHVSGGLSLGLAALFAAVLFVAWLLEESRWQISERVGLFVVLLSLPLFYLDWKYQTSFGDQRERVGVSALAHLILFLSTVKLLQKKADRDWVFLYLISFFEVLLAAGLSISPTFLATLGLYMLCALSTIISFEMEKARRAVEITETRLLVAPDSTLIRRLTKRREGWQAKEARRLPLVSLTLLLLIFTLALPLFFIAPRFSGQALARSNKGLSGISGFSDTVTLGDIGRLQQSNEVVMRVRVEGAQEVSGQNRDLRWRGVALDNFDGLAWRKSSTRIRDVQVNPERNFFRFGTTEGLHRLTTQTFFLEPLDTPVLFAAPRAVALQAPLPYVRHDEEESLSTRRHELERLTYKVFSDMTAPDASTLRRDERPYIMRHARYLQLPATLDPRIAVLAREMIAREGARNRYDKARAIEKRLQNDFGYTLEMKARPPDPLADFLFRVREGHCEYFSTAMTVMLRTQGIAARVVNGFQTGEYNDAADVYTVRQREAHSWVEVYFPEADSWITFDPTPAAGRPVLESAGLTARLGKYAEALEMFWIQYVVGYDKQEQRSLATSLRRYMVSLRQTLAESLNGLKQTINSWWNSIQGNGVSGSPPLAIVLVLLLLLIIPVGVLLIIKLRHTRFWRWGWKKEERRSSVVEFYERMTRVLAERGMSRAENQTPLEFATTVNQPQALNITRAYNRVRFGAQQLSRVEAAEIEEWLREMERKEP